MDEVDATSMDQLDGICGAGNFMVSMQSSEVVYCTLPAWHPAWTTNEASGYSYNHHNAQHDVWWNGPSLGQSMSEWMAARPVREEAP